MKYILTLIILFVFAVTSYAGDVTGILKEIAFNKARNLYRYTYTYRAGAADNSTSPFIVSEHYYRETSVVTAKQITDIIKERCIYLNDEYNKTITFGMKVGDKVDIKGVVQP